MQTGDAKKLKDREPPAHTPDAEPIPVNLQLEFFGAKASLALAAEDKALAQEAVEELKKAAINHPFWANQRDQLICLAFTRLSHPNSFSSDYVLCACPLATYPVHRRRKA